MSRTRFPGAGVLRPIWRALPGDLMAEIIIRACGVPATSRRRVIVRDEGRGAQELILVVDPRLARYLDVETGGIRPLAQTLGHLVLTREPLSDATLRHEAEHVRQWEALGPLYLPLYVLEGARLLLAGRHHYWENRFEARARARELAALDVAPNAAGDGVSGTDSR